MINVAYADGGGLFVACGDLPTVYNIVSDMYAAENACGDSVINTNGWKQLFYKLHEEPADQQGLLSLLVNLVASMCIELFGLENNVRIKKMNRIRFNLSRLGKKRYFTKCCNNIIKHTSMYKHASFSQIFKNNTKLYHPILCCFTCH